MQNTPPHTYIVLVNGIINIIFSALNLNTLIFSIETSYSIITIIVPHFSASIMLGFTSEPDKYMEINTMGVVVICATPCGPFHYLV